MSATPNPAAAGLANWVERISQQDMPMFGQTIRKPLYAQLAPKKITL
jgi:hypothetical protein